MRFTGGCEAKRHAGSVTLKDGAGEAAPLTDSRDFATSPFFSAASAPNHGGPP